jgi:hypothetical protein
MYSFMYMCDHACAFKNLLQVFFYEMQVICFENLSKNKSEMFVFLHKKWNVFKTNIMEKNGLTNIIFYYSSCYSYTKRRFRLSLQVFVIFTPNGNSNNR